MVINIICSKNKNSNSILANASDVGDTSTGSVYTTRLTGISLLLKPTNSGLKPPVMHRRSTHCLKKSIAILLITSGLSANTSCEVFGKTQN
jgi:hypothetical protein